MKKHFMLPGIGIRNHFVLAARSLIGKSRYQYLSERCTPPETVNCVMFVRHTLEQIRDTVPRISPGLLGDLYKSGTPTEEPLAGDLVFTLDPTKTAIQVSARPNRFATHVGILTEYKSVVHASAERRTVIEEPVDRFAETSGCLVAYVSLFERSACLSSDDIYRHIRREWPAGTQRTIDDHLDTCDDCYVAVQLRNRMSPY